MPELSTTNVEMNEAAAAPAKKTVKKAAVKKSAKKAPAKKTTKTAKKGTKKAATKERSERGPSKSQVQILKILNKKGEQTRTQLSEAMDNAFVGSDMMGHLDPNQVKPNSLLGRGLVTVATYPDKESGAEGPAHYKITAAGKKAIETAAK